MRNAAPTIPALSLPLSPPLTSPRSPTYAQQHSAAEEKQVCGRVRGHLLWWGLAVAVLVPIAAGLAVWIANPATWVLPLVVGTLFMVLIAFRVWIAGTFDTAEDTRKVAEHDVELKHQQRNQP